jgi:hypothetical protein
MTQESKHETAAATMRRINRVWLDGKVDDLGPMVHPDIVMTFPGFAGQIQGREPFLAGFRDFCENARIHQFHDHDQQVATVGDTSVVTFRYEMIYERESVRYQASGRDLWVFQRQGSAWIAVWRTMLEMEEKPA